MEYFVKENSIVREIWGNSDTILLIFAGASAEFALNKAVDWLYFTGKLPNDPLGRLFSTVAYARKIVFSEKGEVIKAIERINAAHSAVVSKRGSNIPDWAYRDVLFMLIDYSIRCYEVLERSLNPQERQEVYQVFHEVGFRMGIKGLPENYRHFEKMRINHLDQHMHNGEFTKDLYKQYRKHLGSFRYKLLLESQILIVPGQVKRLMYFRSFSLLQPMVYFYKFSRKIRVHEFLKSMILPSQYKSEFKSLDINRA
ncbi:MAG: DUF2236 domain-containing protein [Gramella sp.]|nr:DUF2236 domain-containing protein [Christiangramia sp.]